MEHKRDAKPQVGGGATFLTRRNLVHRAAWAVAAAAFPWSAKLAAQDGSPSGTANISPMMFKLSAYMSEARNSALPDKVLQETKHHILDTFAAMISGSELLRDAWP